MLEAPSDSNLFGTSLSIEPGTFAVDAAISIEEAGSLSSALSAASFGVGFDAPAGTAVSIDNDAGITELPPTSPPMTLQIPVFPGNNLLLAGETVLAVLFRQSGDAGNCEEELIPPAKLSVKASSVELKTRKFGAFQALYVSKTDLDKKLSESEDGRIVITRPGCKVITVSEMKKLPEFKISDLSIQRRDRVLGFKASVEGEKVSACYLNLLVSGQEDAITKKSNLSSFKHDFSSSYNQLSGKAQISCLSESSQEAATDFETFSLSAKEVSESSVSFILNPAIADGYILNEDVDLSSPVAILSSIPGDIVSASFTDYLAYSVGFACDSLQDYSKDSIPNINDLTANGDYSLCAKIVTRTGSVIYKELQNYIQRHSITSCNELSGGDWLSINADSDYGNTNFCVMTYEARKDSNEKPISQKDNQPWTNLSQNTAKEKCSSLGQGYKLISNDEWMSVASAILNQGSNWFSRSVGSGIVNSGHVDNWPNRTCDSNSEKVGYQTATVGQNCVKLSDAFEQKRTHDLPDSQVIWDFSGNAAEWTSFVTSSGNLPTVLSASTYYDWSTVIDPFLGGLSKTMFISQQAIDNQWGNAQRIGTVVFGGADSSERALLRGGKFNDGATPTGVFAANFDFTPDGDSSSESGNIGAAGFRCTYTLP